MSIPPSAAGPGDRQFANLIRIAIKFYLRHKEEIDNTLSTLMIDALMTIVGGLGTDGEITELNIPGPQ